MKPVRVYVLPYNGRRYDNVISYIQVSNCNTSVSDWNQLSLATDMRVISLLMSNYGNDCPVDFNDSCSGLGNAVSFVYENKESNSPDIEEILPCVPVYPEMAEVVFGNMSWSELPTEFVKLFPNLQTLELPGNNFTVPPEIFPWNNQEHSLPRNLSRSRYMAHHYSVSIDLDIPANKYRRVYNLANNNIKNLTEHAFHGYLQMINLKGNRMVYIGSATFQNVTGLQNIDLSHNSFSSLPVTLFQGLTGLRRLDISCNILTSLQVGLFGDQISLRYLSLANNSLTALPKGLLTYLRQLEVLHLEHNFLTTLSTQTFPVDSVVLSEMYFQSNPIKSLPEFIFWIRSLTHTDFSNTDITFDNLTEFIQNIDTNRLGSSVVDSASDMEVEDLKQRAQKLRTIDLSSCKIESIYLKEYTTEMKAVVLVLLQHFKFVLTNNPLNCDCKIAPLSKFLNDLKENGTVSQYEYYFQEWVCQNPIELQNRPLLSVKEEETYCITTKLPRCPGECKCYNRSVNGNIIVDCRHAGLKRMHRRMPAGLLELWYGHNNITTIQPQHYLKRTKVLDISFNQVTNIQDSVFKETKLLEKLYIQSNILTYLPRALESLQLSAIELSHNNYHCDCNSLWMKHWVLRNRHVINEWKELSCSTMAKGRKLVEVNDSDFICKEDFNSFQHVIVPSIICCVILFFLIILGVLVYAYRLECKVLMFVYLGVHPFDHDDNDLVENLDCVIVHSGATTDWVMDNIVKILEGEAYRFVVCDMARDFIVGFSVQENLSNMVRHSKRIIFCMSSDWEPSNESFKLAWNIAQEKIKETKAHYGIIVSHGVSQSNITDKQLLRFIKHGRFIDSSKRLFVEKVIYSMPRRRQTWTGGTSVANEQTTQAEFAQKRSLPLSFVETEDDILTDEGSSSPGIHMHRCHAFISYSYDDIDFVIHDLQPSLESKGYKLCIADRDFIPGASKEENILSAIHASKRTIFILSRSHIFDEWSLFTFRAACEKSLREKTNHLIVIIKDELDVDKLDKEVQHYLKSYVSLNVNDRWYEQKLFNGLPLLNHSKQLHTSPLFTNTVEIDNVAFDMRE